MKKFDVVIARHNSLVDYLTELGMVDGRTKLLVHATEEDVRGKHVCGVLPHSLSCLTASFTEVPLSIPLELRGAELTLEHIRQFAGEAVTYRVTAPSSFSSEIIEIDGGVSTNGRWGMSIVGPRGVSLRLPQEGCLASIGTINGMQSYDFIPQPGCGKWVLVCGDAEPIVGCSVVGSVSLQSGNHITILIGGDFMAVTSYGYKRRSSSTKCYIKGSKVDVSAPVMAAMGLIPCNRDEVSEKPPELPSALSEALKKAGLA